MIKTLDIYHARPDEDDPSYVIYDEDEFGLQNKNRKNEGETQAARPPFRGSAQTPIFGPPPQTVNLVDFIYQFATACLLPFYYFLDSCSVQYKVLCYYYFKISFFFIASLRYIGLLQMFDDTALIPSVPYYELPAGMMMPLIEMEDVLVTFSVPVFITVTFTGHYRTSLI